MMHKRRVKHGVMAAALAVVTAIASFPVSAVDNLGVISSPDSLEINQYVSASSSVSITKSVGYAEGAYVEWAPVSGADGYNVYCDGVQLDSMLVRQYPSNFRADAVGLKAGSHTLKVVPVSGGKEISGSAEATVSVKAHDRSGFGFVNGTSSGAYNEDGTLKNNAVVVYVTEQNKNTVTADINSTGKGASTLTGIQDIILGYKKGKESRPLCVRVIGNITDPEVLTKGDLYLDTVTAGMTIEGIGNDAVFNGFGLVMKNCSNVEVRNIGFMNCNSSEGDDCGLQQANNHVWVHNCDFFYGDAGSDADQVKGDGALDTKKSTYVTHSYNHFWDNGKCNLQGMKDETTENYITYHHNWYDHSDSRHPRIRTCSVHIYNNYFDGNAKYGVGVTMGASAFVNNNYFRNCKNPMMSSGQGTDAKGEGTFSGETGGIIKACANYIEGAASYITYEQDNKEFDAYEVSNPSDTVPDSVKAVSGGTTYNNFDTSSLMYGYKPDKAEDVPS
ncbi:MAG: pectate lyase, partial [Ruminococcus sp.]|nr:pectate lyase [Ruminococcus sp.]